MLSTSSARTVALELMGQDRPGIVRDVSAVLALTIGNITFRSTASYKAVFSDATNLNVGDEVPPIVEGLLTTVAWQLAEGGPVTYAYEGAVFVMGAAVQWLRDGLGLIKHAADTGPLADKSDSTQSVYLVPAFVGLGAPYWNPRVRGALFGLTRNTGPAELAHAALDEQRRAAVLKHHGQGHEHKQRREQQHGRAGNDQVEAALHAGEHAEREAIDSIAAQFWPAASQLCHCTT